MGFVPFIIIVACGFACYLAGVVRGTAACYRDKSTEWKCTAVVAIAFLLFLNFLFLYFC